MPKAMIDRTTATPPVIRPPRARFSLSLPTPVRLDLGSREVAEHGADQAEDQPDRAAAEGEDDAGDAGHQGDEGLVVAGRRGRGVRRGGRRHPGVVRARGAGAGRYPPSPGGGGGGAGQPPSPAGGGGGADHPPARAAAGGGAASRPRAAAGGGRRAAAGSGLALGAGGRMCGGVDSSSAAAVGAGGGRRRHPPRWARAAPRAGAGAACCRSCVVSVGRSAGGRVVVTLASQHAVGRDIPGSSRRRVIGRLRPSARATGPPAGFAACPAAPFAVQLCPQGSHRGVRTPREREREPCLTPAPTLRPRRTAPAVAAMPHRRRRSVAPPRVARPTTSSCWSILVTLFCCLPFGIVGDHQVGRGQQQVERR